MKTLFLTGLLAMATMSQAAVTIFLDSTAPMGTNTGYNYHLEQTEGDVLRTGDFFTIYDVAGFVSASTPVDFNFSVQNSGVNPSTPVGGVAPALDAAMANVTFIRSGENTNAMSISGFQIVSTFLGLVAYWHLQARTRKNTRSN